jgi:N-acyl homoserine lactone hydrolase
VPCGVHLNLLTAYDSIHKVKEAADIIIPIHDLSIGRHATIPSDQ